MDENDKFFVSSSGTVFENQFEDTNEEIIENENASKVFLYDDGNIYLLTDTENDDETEDRECDFLSRQIIDTSSENVNILQQYGLTFVEDSEINDQQDGEVSNSSGDVDIETLADIVQALKCKECDFTTLDVNALISHHQECHANIKKANAKNDNAESGENITYLCSKCSTGLSSIQECRDHMIKSHNFQYLLSEQNDDSATTADEKPGINEKNSNKNKSDDDKSTTEVKFFQAYWLQPKTSKEVRMRLCSDRKVKCSMKSCVYRFKTIELMNQHRSCHSKDNASFETNYKNRKTYHVPFACTFCNIEFRNWPNCSMHLWKTHQINVDLIKCPLCDEVHTHSAAKMVQHLEKHAKLERLKTDGGNYKTYKEDQINENCDSAPRCRWYNQKKCEICQKIYANSKSLKIHIQAVHNKLKPFICNVCGHCSSKKHMLQLHMRQHTGEKPFACDFCPYKTGDHNTLRKHRMKHTGERPYSCTYCQFSSIQSSSLKSHYKSMHADKPKK